MAWRRIWRLRLIGAAVALAGLAGITLAALSASADGPDPDPAVFRVFAQAVTADSALPIIPGQLEGCELIGEWTDLMFGESSSSSPVRIFPGAPLPPPWEAFGVNVTLPAASADDYEIVVVNESKGRVLRTELSGTGASRTGVLSFQTEDLVPATFSGGDNGIKVYLCRKPRSGPASWGTTVQNLNPLTIHVTPPPGTWTVGPVLIVDPGTFPGDEATFDLVVANHGEEITGPFDIVTTLNFDTIPIVAFDPELVANPFSAPSVTVLGARPNTNDRTTFDVEVASTNALWNFNVNFKFDNSTLEGTFAAPVIIHAYEPWVGSLNFPNNVLAPGTTDANFLVNLTGGSLPWTAPNQAQVIPGPITHAYTIGGGENDWALYGFFYNPTDATVTFDNEQADAVGRVCLTGEASSIYRAPLAQEEPAAELLFGELLFREWREVTWSRPPDDDPLLDRLLGPFLGPHPFDVQTFSFWLDTTAECYNAQHVAVR